MMPYQPIENHGVIGDLHTVALVGMDGSIDFMCFPRFDSPTLFGALLDAKNGGFFKIAPLFENAHSHQMYLPDSAILLTRFSASEGVAELSDFMPITDLGHSHALVRRVKAIRGDIRFRVELRPQFNYGRSTHRVERRRGALLFSADCPDQPPILLQTSVPLRIQEGAGFAEFSLKAGEIASFVLECAGEDKAPWNLHQYVSGSFKQTLNYWQGWIARSNYQGRWRQIVDRAAITLKLLTHSQTGALVAAPTFGLPEELGGVRNWDYRYTWIRDASFALYALMRLGYTTEAEAFMRWIEQRCREIEPGKHLQVLYGIDGERHLAETELKHWEGYRGSRPVRIGNASSGQMQLDIYGELLDAVYIFNKLEPISYDFWKNLTGLIDWVCGHWRQPDRGIWEVRSGSYRFLHSRVMCWVAIDRGLRLARHRSFPAPWDKWLRTRDQIFRCVYEDLWDSGLGSFVQYEGSKAVDASALLMPLVNFISTSDPRWRSTLRVLNQHLSQDVLMKRYSLVDGAQDGLPGREGTFSACSFWNVECLARAGDKKKARFHFEKMLSYGNHLGLFSEEIGLQGEQLGNFPQAFTHLAVITAAYSLDGRGGTPAGQQAL